MYDSFDICIAFQALLTMNSGRKYEIDIVNEMHAYIYSYEYDNIHFPWNEYYLCIIFVYTYIY